MLRHKKAVLSYNNCMEFPLCHDGGLVEEVGNVGNFEDEVFLFAHVGPWPWLACLTASSAKATIISDAQARCLVILFDNEITRAIGRVM